VIELTVTKVKDLLAEAVALKGADYVYTTPDGKQGSVDYQPTCLYVHGSRPGCIVGHVLNKAGVSLARLREEERNDASNVLRNLREDLAYEDGVSQLLQDAQGAQDEGVPWGEAVRQALASLDGD
jgi:hypothetical protein